LGAALASTLSAQDVQQCVQGAPALSSSTPETVKGEFNRLRWATGYRNYVEIQSKVGAPATVDSIDARSARLFTAVGGIPDSLQSIATALHRRLAAARSEVAQRVTQDSLQLRPQQTVDATPFKLEGDTEEADRAVLGASGQEIPFRISEANRNAAAVVCAAAAAAEGFLEYLMMDEFKRVAANYAKAVKEWDMFIAGGYSMTFIERLAASCRLGPAGWVINPLRNCSKKPDRDLLPPRQQIVFAHPSAGLAPLFKADSLYQTLVIIEWYGYMRHLYGETKVRTLGVSFASSQPAVGKTGWGGSLRTPWASAGIFARKSDGPLYTVSADVLGWIPAIRQAASTLRITSLDNALATLAK
jgi:hypothetical protein